MTKLEMEMKAKRIKTLENMKSNLDAEIEQLKDELKDELERQGRDEITAGPWRILWKLIQEQRFNSTRFRAENPEAYDAYRDPRSYMKFQIV